MYPNNQNQQQSFDYNKLSEDAFIKREQEPSQYPMMRAPPSYVNYIPMYPPQMNHSRFEFDNSPKFPYSGFPQISQISRPPVNVYPIRSMAQYNPGDASDIDILRGIAMLGHLFNINPEETTKQSPERKKKISKDEREIKLGNIVFKPSKGDWQCKEKSCMNWNYAKREKCNKCDKHKDHEKDVIKSEKRVIRRFWACPDCQFQNFEHKERCYKCGLNKKETDVILEKS